MSERVKTNAWSQTQDEPEKFSQELPEACGQDSQEEPAEDASNAWRHKDVRGDLSEATKATVDWLRNAVL